MFDFLNKPLEALLRIIETFFDRKGRRADKAAKQVLFLHDLNKMSRVRRGRDAICERLDKDGTTDGIELAAIAKLFVEEDRIHSRLAFIETEQGLENDTMSRAIKRLSSQFLFQTP